MKLTIEPVLIDEQGNLHASEERKEFEAWANEMGLQNFTRMEDGNYANDLMRFAWTTWNYFRSDRRGAKQ